LKTFQEIHQGQIPTCTDMYYAHLTFEIEKGYL
jgi:hypothetical protein